MQEQLPRHEGHEVFLAVYVFLRGKQFASRTGHVAPSETFCVDLSSTAPLGGIKRHL